MRAFTYVAPKTVDATLEALRTAQPGTKILALGIRTVADALRTAGERATR
jgi:hypothetical protein